MRSIPETIDAEIISERIARPMPTGRAVAVVVRAKQGKQKPRRGFAGALATVLRVLEENKTEDVRPFLPR